MHDLRDALLLTKQITKIDVIPWSLCILHFRFHVNQCSNATVLVFLYNKTRVFSLTKYTLYVGADIYNICLYKNWGF